MGHDSRPKVEQRLTHGGYLLHVCDTIHRQHKKKHTVDERSLTQATTTVDGNGEK